MFNGHFAWSIYQQLTIKWPDHGISWSVGDFINGHFILVFVMVNYHDFYNVGPPQIAFSWFRFAPVTIVINTITKVIAVIIELS